MLNRDVLLTVSLGPPGRHKLAPPQMIARR